MKIIGEVTEIPEDALIVNDLSITGFSEDFGWKDDDLKLLEGKKISEGGLLPEDNVRIYVPMDINQKLILFKLELLFDELGELTWRTESEYARRVWQLMTLLKVYDQSLIAQGSFPTVQTGETVHSKLAIETAKKMCRILMRNEGTGDTFPYDEIAELSQEYGFEMNGY